MILLAVLLQQGLDTDYGPALAVTIARAASEKDSDVIAHKALNLSLGHGVSAAFDTESCRFVHAWTGGFLDLGGSLLASNTDSVSARPAGATLFSVPRGPPARFLGFVRTGRRVVLRYVLGSVEILDAPRALPGGVFVRDLHLGPGAVEIPVADASTASAGALASRNGVRVLAVPTDAPRLLSVACARESSPAPVPEDPRPLLAGGPALWGPARADLVAGDAKASFIVDTLAAPVSNPWKAWLRFTALDFLPDGRVAVASLNGDVFTVAERGGVLEWRRFAAGLNQPLGLKVVDGLVYVRGRDQITRLRDLNDDGEADAYEAFNTDGPALANYQDFAFDLETDAGGSFYWTRNGNAVAGKPGHGCAFRTSKDGARTEIFATGLRAACGMSVGPDGTVTASDQQGQWIPASKISVLRQGGFYGHVWTAGGADKTRFDPPLLWIPHAVDNSSGGQAWVPPGAWGELSGELLHFSYGTCSLFHVMRDGAQGALVRLPLTLQSGVLRGRFRDGALYAAGMRGWQTNAAKEVVLHRIRRGPAPRRAVRSWKVVKDGMVLGFSDPLEAEGIEDAFSLQGWNYAWWDRYGSPEFSLKDSKKQGRDPFEVGAALSADRLSVTLSIPGLRPMMQFHLKGRPPGAVPVDLYGTIHEVPK